MRKNSRWAAAAHTLVARDSALARDLGLRRGSSTIDVQHSGRLSQEADLMGGFQELKRTIRDEGKYYALFPSYADSLSKTSRLYLFLLLATLIIPQEILRRSAEATMVSIVQTIFRRLHEADPATEEAKLRLNEEDSQHGDITMSVPADVPGEAVQEGLNAPTDTPVLQAQSSGMITDNVAIEGTANDSNPIIADDVTPSVVTPRPYGLPALLELFRVLVNILDPSDQVHTDSTRLTALGILNATIETCGTVIADYPSLLALVVDHGCKYLFQLARSDNPAVLQAALRTTATLFETMRPHLKLQQELFLTFTVDRLATSPPLKPNATKKTQTNSTRPGTPSTPVLGPVNAENESDKGNPSPARPLVQPARGETRDLMLETLALISRYPGFMVDLYINYDCDINCDNLFERLIEFLTKGVYPMQGSSMSEAQQLHSQFLCLDMLLGFVKDMATRAEGTNEPWNFASIPPEDLMQGKSRKKLVLTGAARFNSKPRLGITFLEENGLVYLDPSEPRSRSLAKFLKSCTRLDKRLLGDYISKPDNIELLKEFIGLFDFKDKPIADAMREMLATFRLPGEAQQIARITETFASIYFASKPFEIKSEDAVYVLAYSVIMLNTDLHNPQIRKRMSIEDYQRNLRGVNSGENFSPEFLQNIYDSIRKREIIMPEEHTGQLGFEYAWKELLARTQQSGPFMVCNTTLFDYDMFNTVWRSAISAIAHAFITFDDDYIIQRAIAGFRQCATLAGRFNLPDVFDFIVVSLSQATGLLADNLPAHVPNYPMVDVEGQSVTVSSLSVQFGMNFKGQLAAVVLFNIVNGNGNALREGWTQIFEMFQNMFMHSLLPTEMLQMEDFLGGVTMIPLRGRTPLRQVQRNDGGLLSTLSSYLMTPYGTSSDNLVPEATDSEVESTLCTIDCIKSCRLDELYAQIMQLEADALAAAVRALEALAHERTITKLKQEMDDVSVPYSQSPADEGPYVLPYDPAAVFLLEMMMSIARKTPKHTEELWPIIFEHLSALLSDAIHYSVLLIERAVVALLRLCLILTQKNKLRDQVYLSLDLIANLPPSVANSVAEHVTAGVGLILQQKSIASTQTEWNLIVAALRTTVSHPEAARSTFDLVAGIVSEGPTQWVTPDNFTCLVAILDDFASTGGDSVPPQPQRPKRARPQPLTESPPVERGRKALDLLCDLKRFIAPFSEVVKLPPAKAWRQYSLPLLTSLGKQSTNPVKSIRHVAISQLQRLLLGSQLVYDETEHGHIEEIFNSVIFPLVDDLLKPQVFYLDPQGMSETRVRASTLLCKVFVHFEVRDGRSKADVRVLWIQILDLLDRLISAEKSEQLYEAVSESLKNAILVMNAAGILVPPAVEDNRDEQQRTFWTATQARLERFLPGFLAEVVRTQEAVPTADDETSPSVA
ncbi:hypothetical protein ID866_5104 [Astraeus odoratus]|nr:hypothetical protein ID866_5104 [Astraeus odoratus]